MMSSFFCSTRVSFSRRHSIVIFFGGILNGCILRIICLFHFCLSWTQGAPGRCCSVVVVVVVVVIVFCSCLAIRWVFITGIFVFWSER